MNGLEGILADLERIDATFRQLVAVLRSRNPDLAAELDALLAGPKRAKRRTPAHWEDRGQKACVFYLISDKRQDKSKILGVVYPDLPGSSKSEWIAYGENFTRIGGLYSTAEEARRVVEKQVNVRISPE
jgi:hypothetical protein